jgi:hypothetical protein
MENERFPWNADWMSHYLSIPSLPPLYVVKCLVENAVKHNMIPKRIPAEDTDSLDLRQPG